MYDLYPFITLFTPLHSPDHPGRISMQPGVTVNAPIACLLCDGPLDGAPGRLGYMADSKQATRLFALCRRCSLDRHDYELTQKISAKLSATSASPSMEEVIVVPTREGTMAARVDRAVLKCLLISQSSP
jgi:hypothetical protein